MRKNEVVETLRRESSALIQAALPIGYRNAALEFLERELFAPIEWPDFHKDPRRRLFLHAGGDFFADAFLAEVERAIVFAYTIFVCVTYGTGTKITDRGSNPAWLSHTLAWRALYPPYEGLWRYR